eukprot:311790_1
MDTQLPSTQQLNPILSTLQSLESKEDIAKFFNTNNANTIKSVINYFLNKSPAESTDLLRKLISCTQSSNSDSSFPFVHYGIALELMIAGLVMVFKPELFLQIFQLEALENYDYLRTTGLLCIVLSIHYFFEARNRVNPLIQIAAYVRVIVAFAFAYFVHKGWVQKPLMAFGIADFITALLQFNQSKL